MDTLPTTTRRQKLFWQKVHVIGECWTWTASRNGKGYGKFWDGERIASAHRFSFEQRVGPIPPGQMVLHRCDNRACVRPDHLFLGTQLDNMRDMIDKGRRGYTGMPGERNPKAKLTPEQVAELRHRFEHGEIRADLAREFGVGWTAVDRIVKRVGWMGGELEVRAAA